MEEWFEDPLAGYRKNARHLFGDPEKRVSKSPSMALDGAWVSSHCDEAVGVTPCSRSGRASRYSTGCSVSIQTEASPWASPRMRYR